MVFVRDEGSVYDAPLDVVWAYFGSGREHSDAHRHREVRREAIRDRSGQYSWEQDFRGAPTRFTMRWTSFAPLGLAYDVLEGPFAGSRFFLYYIPQGGKTGVSVVGEFTSPSIPSDRLTDAVDEFFSLEFLQDREAIRERAARLDPGAGVSR